MLRKIRNETLDEIQFLNKAIERCTNNINRLKTTKQFNPSGMIEQNKKEIKSLEERLLSEKSKLESIDDGTYEMVLNEEIKTTKDNISTKSANTKRKKQQNVITPITPKLNNKSIYWDPRNTDRNIDKDMDYAERSYFRDCSSIPDYILNKLENMPANMGYIWKDIWCYGCLREQQPDYKCTLFEKKYDKFYIHTFNRRTREYCIFEKDQNNQKHLIKTVHTLPSIWGELSRKDAS